MKKTITSLTILLILSNYSFCQQQFNVQYLNCQNCTAANHQSTTLNFDYDSTATNFISSHVTSDYGPRDLGTDHYDWHGGVDYSSEGGNHDFGDGIIAIRGGTITLMGRNRYKYIMIDGNDNYTINGDSIPYDFGYGHLFQSPISNQKSGKFYWQKVLNINPAQYAIILNDSTALFTDNNFEVVHPETNDTISTINNINAGQIIGPIGNSITDGSVTAHLHLYLFENNQFGTHDTISKNPLQFVNHDEPTHKVEIFNVITEWHQHVHGNDHTSWQRFKPDSTKGINLTYPGTAEGQILIRTRMDSVANGTTYANAVMNVDKVGIYIQDEASINPLNTWDTIRGPNFNSVLHLDGSINDNENRYPTNFISRGQAQDKKTGMQPWCYSDRNERLRPWDFFNFADFATRIHYEDLQGDTYIDQQGVTRSLIYSADVPDHARYIDGNYFVKAIVTDVTGTEFEGPKDSLGNVAPIEIEIDNFIPYVKSVRVIPIGSGSLSDQIRYFWSWGSIDANRDSINDGYIMRDSFELEPVSINQGQNLGIVITTSEQMDTMYAVIPNLSSDTIVGLRNSFLAFLFGTGTYNTWIFDFGSNSNLNDSTDYRIHFFGQDVNGNDLLNLSDMTDDLEGGRIFMPKRQNTNNDSTSWLPLVNHIGIDSVHVFNLEGCTMTGNLISNGIEAILSNSCIKTSDVVISQSNASQGNSDGSINLSFYTNSDLYIYEWTDLNNIVISTEKDLVNIPPGTYCVKITDENCCIAEVCRTITECSNLIESIDANFDNILSLGYANVKVDPNSTPPWSFEWSNGDTTQTLSDIPQGEYCVTVTDGGGCTTEECISLCIEGDIIVPNTTTCICIGGYGAIDITVNGDNGPYSFDWLGPNGYYSSEEDPHNLVDTGLYTVQVTNIYGCMKSFSQLISTCSFEIDDFDTTITNDCNGNGGSIEISIPSANSAETPFTFIWSKINSGTLPPNLINTNETLGTSTAFGLEAGTYCVVIASNNGCATSTCEFTIEEFEKPDITYEITPVTSPNLNDGTISLSVQGGSSPYTYNWSNGATTSSVSGLAAGIYEVEVGYGSGCIEQLSIEVLTCNALEMGISFETNVTPLSPLNQGAIDLTVTGGENYNFEYTWVKIGEGIVGTTEDISHLNPGEYCVTVSYPLCNIEEEVCVVICDFELKVIYIDHCNYTNAIVQVTSGANPYTYEWNNGNTTNQNQLNYGIEYCVTVTDNNSCEMELCMTPEFPQIEVIANIVNATFGESNGQINIENIEGVAPFSIEWSNGELGNSITNLIPGEYCAFITDGCENSVETCFQVECEITANQVEVDITPPSCSSNSFGSLNLIVAGTQAFQNTYIWCNGATTEDLTNLVSGQYCVTVTNIFTNCVYSDCFEVEPSGTGNLDVTFSTRRTPCTGGTGGITAEVTGGIAPYTYIWSDINTGQVLGTEQMLSEIPTGSYLFEATDSLGCTIIDIAYLWGVDSYLLNLAITQPECEGEGGTVEATPDGGIAPYYFEWRKFTAATPFYTETSSTSSVATGLDAGAYYVKTTDNAGCVVSKSFYILSPSSQMNLNETIVHICEQGDLGSISLNPIGGTPPYLYSWSTGSTSSEINNLPSGTYTVLVTETGGCSQEESFYVSNSPPPIITEVEIILPSCNDSNDGTTKIVSVNGAGKFSYQWETDTGWNSGPNATNELNALSVGTYSVTATDRYGCTTTREFTNISAQHDFIIVPENIQGANSDTGEGGQIEVSIHEFYYWPTYTSYVLVSSSEYYFSWIGANGFSSNDKDISNLTAGTYTLTATHMPTGCSKTTEFTISDCSNSDMNGLTAFIDFENVIPCVGGNSTGSISVTAWTNNPPLNFYWSGPSSQGNNLYGNNPIISGLTETGWGDYSVTVTDGCSQKVLTQTFLCKGYEDAQLDAYYDVSHDCDEGGSISIKDVIFNVPSNVFPGPSTIYPYQVEIKFFNGSNIISSGVVNIQEDGSITLVSGSMEVTDINAGIYTVVATNEYGFSDTDFFQILSENDCQINLSMTNSISNTSLPSGALGYCITEFPCSDETSGGILEYVPYNSDLPCSRGYLQCKTGCEVPGLGFLKIDIPLNSSGVLIENLPGGKCGCYFPSGVSDDEDLPIISQLYDLPVDPALFGVFDCVQTEPPNPNDTTKVDPEIVYPCDSCPFGCEYVHDFSNCIVYSYCNEDPSNVPVDTIEYVKDVCLSYDVSEVPSNINAGCILRVKCSLFSDCYNEDVVDIPITYVNGTSTQTESDLIQLLTLAGVTDISIDCGNNEYCNCEELLESDDINLCQECPNLVDNNVNAFQSNQGNEIINQLEKHEKFKIEIADFQAKLFPNPFTDVINIEIQTKIESEISIKITNVLGNIIWKEESSIQKGIHNFEVQFDGSIPVGIYQVLISDSNGNQIVKKIIHALD